MNGYKVAVASSTRADYGHLYWLLRAIMDDDALELSLYVTGSHLSPDFGHTVDEVEGDGFRVHRRIEILERRDGPSAISKAMGTALTEFGAAFADDRPDVIVLLGDRYEIVPIALASVINGIPVAHIHGGETSSGALDEYFRHAVTKLSSLHFPATDEYARRIAQMGEDPASIHVFGAPGLDHLQNSESLSREAVQVALGLDFGRPTALVTYHPVTTQPGNSPEQVQALLAAIESVDTLQAVFTKANADNEGPTINTMLDEFCRRDPGRFRLVDNLGMKLYLSCLRHIELMIGNSSSGLIEAPSLELPVVNVGARQDGRVRARNVIDVRAEMIAIRDGVHVALTDQFRRGLQGMTNPYDRYGDGRVSSRIARTLREYLAGPKRRVKPFFDLDTRWPHV